MKKKLLATVLTAALAFGAITGCGSQKTEETAATRAVIQRQQQVRRPASTQEAEAAHKMAKSSCSEAWSDRCYL